MTQPYYDDGFCRIYHADCRDVLDEIGEFDLLLTDPPYGIEFKSNRRDDTPAFDFIKGDDDAIGIVKMLEQVVRQNLRRYRHGYVFGPLALAPLVAAGLVQEPIELIWDKGMFGMGDLSLPWASQHEAIQFLVGVKSKANVAKGEGRLAARMRQGSVLRFQRPNSAGATKHPTEKPVALLRALIESSSCIGESVFDPFMGVGSTLVAARLEGRTAVGIEVDERYCEAAARRLASIKEQVA